MPFVTYIIIQDADIVVNCYNILMPEREPFKYPELDKPVNLIIHTKSPEKWLLVDRETGQAYQGSANGKWDKLIPKVRPGQSDELSQT